MTLSKSYLFSLLLSCMSVFALYTMDEVEKQDQEIKVEEKREAALPQEGAQEKEEREREKGAEETIRQGENTGSGTQSVESWYTKPEILFASTGALAAATAGTGYLTCPRIKKAVNKFASCITSQVNDLKDQLKQMRRDEITRADLVRLALAGCGLYAAHKIASSQYVRGYDKIASLKELLKDGMVSAYRKSVAAIDAHKKATACLLVAGAATLALCHVYSWYHADEHDYTALYKQLMKSLTDDELLAIAKIKGYEKLLEKASHNPAVLKENKQFVALMSDEQLKKLDKIIAVYNSTIS